MTTDTVLGALERRIAAFVDASSPSDVFRSLLDGARVATPRAAIFLRREGGWRGWGCSGYPPGANALLRGAAVPFRTDDESAAWPWREVLDTEPLPDLGQPAAAQAVTLPLRVGGKAVAILLAERAPEESPWIPEALGVLVHAARLRLELDLALRRSRGTGVASGVVEETPAAPASPAAIEPRDRNDEPAAAAPPQDPRVEDARRFARLIATDIRLYNEDAVVQGRRHRDLAQRLGDQLARGRESFSRRFDGLGPEGEQILRESYVQVLAGGDGSLIPG
jgi:hypothetical protein